MEQEIQQLQERMNQLESMLAVLIFSDRYIFQKHIQMQDGRNIQLATGTGTKIGTATGQKLAFFNATPAVQQAANADTTGATLAALETEVNELKAVLRTFGFIAT